MTAISNAPLLVLYTGGTLGMVETDQGLAPGNDVEGRVRQVLDALPPERRAALPEFVWREVDRPIDSSSARPEDWASLAADIASHYSDYAGVVVLHGTDTLAWTASSLAFQLLGIDRPVIITGAMLPMEAQGSDAPRNIETALRFAAMPQLQEVALCFNDLLLRGCRARKWQTRDANAFVSPNMSALGMRRGDDWLLFESHGLEATQRGAPRFELADYSNMGDKVIRLSLWPGIQAWQLAAWLGDKRVEGALIEVWGGGNIPEDLELAAVMAEATAQGKIIVAISQCPHGTIEIGHYAAGQLLSEAGVISGDDMTPEAAYTKLVHLLAQPLPTEERLRRFRTPLAGERG